MLPSSRMISQMTPAGARSASRARSTAPSVCPARTSTPPRAGAQREDVARRDDVRRRGVGADGGPDGGGAVGGGDAAPDAVPRVDRHRERGAERGAVLAHHHGQPELLALVLGERQADEPAPVRGHEVDVLGGDALGGDAEIALVLAILVVHQDDHAAGADLLQRFLDGDDARPVTPVRHGEMITGAPRGGQTGASRLPRLPVPRGTRGRRAARTPPLQGIGALTRLPCQAF